MMFINGVSMTFLSSLYNKIIMNKTFPVKDIFRSITHFCLYIILVILLLHGTETLKKYSYSNENVEKKIILKIFTEDNNNLKINRLIYTMSESYNLDRFLLYAIIKVNSNFDEDLIITSKTGSLYIGLMQLNSKDFTSYTPKKLLNPVVNLSLGAKRLKDNLNISNDNTIAALAMYKSRYKITDKKYGKITLNYIENVLRERERIKLKVDNYIKQNYDL